MLPVGVVFSVLQYLFPSLTHRQTSFKIEDSDWNPLFSLGPQTSEPCLRASLSPWKLRDIFCSPASAQTSIYPLCCPHTFLRAEGRAAGGGLAFLCPGGLLKDLVLHMLLSQDLISDQGTATFSCTVLHSEHSLLKSDPSPMPQLRELKGPESL